MLETRPWVAIDLIADLDNYELTHTSITLVLSPLDMRIGLSIERL